MQGKIVKGISGFYYIHVVGAGIYECKAKGSFRNQKIKPLVGDNVEIAILDENEKKGNIEKILPRKNELIRPAVANIDGALVVFAAAKPKPNFHLLDRFLVMMEYQHIPAVLCFNKTDLVDEEERKRLQDIYAAAGYPICFISAKEQIGIETVKEQIEGKTFALAGPSGVGKSSLTNVLQSEIRMETGEISMKIERGKHTTRHSELLVLEEDEKVEDCGSYIVDTPGFSSLYVNDFEKEQLKYYFPEFGPYEGLCRFSGCDHVHEPDCAVKQAAEDGKIHEIRYNDYVAMYRELQEKRRY